MHVGDKTIQVLNHEEGVQDLPITVRSPFIAALRFEAQGLHRQAAERLNAAVIKEDAHK